METFRKLKYVEDVRVIHFVRDPFDMVISGFLYHSQIPAPEKWLTAPNYNLCAFNTSLTDQWLPKLAELKRGGKSGFLAVNQSFHAVVEKCHELNRKDNIHGNSSLHSMLHHAKNSSTPNDALLLEAIRALIPSVQGDILRMGVNALYEDKRISKRIFTSDFPAGDEKSFLKTATGIYEFLMPDNYTSVGSTAQKSLAPPFWKCMNKSEAIKFAKKAAFVPESRVIASLNQTLETKDW